MDYLSTQKYKNYILIAVIRKRRRGSRLTRYDGTSQYGKIWFMQDHEP